MRRILLALLMPGISLLAACSYMTDFVVVNESSKPVEVRYRIGETTIDPLVANGRPAILAASQLSASDRQWRELSPQQYVFDREGRWVAVSLAPGEALRITSKKDWSEGAIVEIKFSVEELDLRGESGELILKGDQVYKDFVRQSWTLCTLTYR